MPIGLPLQQLPNQSFSIQLGTSLFDIALKKTNGIMAMSISINGTLTIENLICAACSPIIPARYLEVGNFMFLTANNQLPDYTQFGLSQQLLYFTTAELAAFRTVPIASSPQVPTITASFFNPLGALPLRFARKSYNEANILTDSLLQILTSGGDDLVAVLAP